MLLRSGHMAVGVTVEGGRPETLREVFDFWVRKQPDPAEGPDVMKEWTARKDVYEARRQRYEKIMSDLGLTLDTQVTTGFDVVITTKTQLAPDPPTGSVPPPPPPSGGGKAP